MILMVKGSTVAWVLAVIAVILLAALIALYYFGRKMQREQEAQMPMVEANTQTISMLVIDKKKLPMDEAIKAGIPEQVKEQMPFYMRRTKLPVVKAKVQNRMMTLLSDPTAFEQLPVKKECKVTIAGMYIRSVVSIRGGAVPKPTKKQGMLEKLRSKFSN